MYAIAKQYEISASHQLTGMPPEHPCARLHGHTYVVEVSVVGDLDERGMVLDYHALDGTVGAWLKAVLDHRHLNDILDQPTAERLAALVHAEACRRLPERRVRVRVSETPRTWAGYPAED